MTTHNAQAIARLPSTWDARLELGFARNARGSRLVSSHHSGPLYVQKPFYPEGAAVSHVYILHPPGGLVSGDRLEIGIRADAHSHALLTTPGAGRVYRARADAAIQCQTITIDVASAAVVEWLPQETIVFNGAHTALNTHVNLARGARYIGWEVTSLGLPACNSRFDRGELQQCLQLSVDSRLRLRERLRAGDPAILRAEAGLRSMPINGIFVAGPFADASSGTEVLASLRDATLANDIGDCLQGLTLVSGFIVGRYLGHCSEQGKKLFECWWAQVRPQLLARAACRPRIWST